MTVNDKGRVTRVTLASLQHFDPVLLATLTHVAVAVGNLLKFSTNKVKTNIDVKGVDKAQWKEIK